MCTCLFCIIYRLWVKLDPSDKFIKKHKQSCLLWYKRRYFTVFKQFKIFDENTKLQFGYKSVKFKRDGVHSP